MAGKKRPSRSKSTTGRRPKRKAKSKTVRKQTVRKPSPSTSLISTLTAESFGRFFATRAITGPVAAARLSAMLSAPPAKPSDLLSTRVAETTPSALAQLHELPIDVRSSLDPRLQLAVINRRAGKPGLALASTAADEVAVIARVKSVDDWLAMADVVPGSVLGSNEDKTWIVTGRLPIEKVERVRSDPTVVSLKASQPIHPALAATIAAMQVAPNALPPGTNPKGGRGIVVGIVDFGCDFAHRNFRLANGKTRLLALWDQAGVAMPSSPFGYGRLYKAAEINQALATSSPYATLGYPSADSLAEVGTHGTHVMDIAAGNGMGSSQPGVAPAADLIFVEAASSDVAWQGPATVNQSFGDSVQLLEAVRFIFDTAGERPCVVNLSLGTNGGPHDGTSLVEQGLDALVNEKPNRAVVIAASNSQEDGIHTSGTIGAGAAHDIVLRQMNSGGGEFELWYPGARRLEVTLGAPDGTVFGPVAPGTNLPIGSAGQVAIFISNRLNDPNNHDNVIGIWIASGMTNDAWTVRLRSIDDSPVEYHAWIERNDRAQASFAASVDTHTLGSISTGATTIAVGSYDAHKPALPLSSFSSSGPTRDGREKPEVSAPGHNVMAARSWTLTGVTRKSGTSMATPAVTGLVALIFAEAHRQGVDLTIAGLRTKLIAGALNNPPAAGGWDPRFGRGRASGASVP